jgi:phosphoglycerate dehydrogenase-like enzyme
MTPRRHLVVDLAGTSRNWALPREGAGRIETSVPEGWEVTIVKSAAPAAGEAGSSGSPEAIAAAGNAEAYFGFGVTPELFTAAPNLRWIHSAAAGVGTSLFPALRESDVVFTNSAGVAAAPIAEHVLGGVLYFLRELDVAVDLQRRAMWDKSPFVGEASRVRELCECRVVIIGTGGVGSAIASRLAALGAHCTGVRRRPELGAPTGFREVIGIDGLDGTLRLADVVVLAAPLTPETRQLLNAARLDCLSPGAIVVNVARGALLDELALAERLSRGEIRGAVLDVFPEEPLPSDSPLWHARGVLITPHVAAVSPRLFWPRTLDLFLENWRRYSDGAPLRNVVDKETGY